MTNHYWHNNQIKPSIQHYIKQFYKNLTTPKIIKNHQQHTKHPLNPQTKPKPNNQTTTRYQPNERIASEHKQSLHHYERRGPEGEGRRLELSKAFSGLRSAVAAPPLRQARQPRGESAPNVPIQMHAVPRPLCRPLPPFEAAVLRLLRFLRVFEGQDVSVVRGQVRSVVLRFRHLLAADLRCWRSYWWVFFFEGWFGGLCFFFNLCFLCVLIKLF